MGREKKKREETSDSDSGPEDRNPAKKAKDSEKASGSKSRSDDGEPTWTLEKKRLVKVRGFKGKTYVDIREYYEDDRGELKPGKKGISLSAQQWQKLKSFVKEIDEALANA